MDDTSKLPQLSAALVIAIIGLLLAYTVPPRKLVPCLIWLSPFQLIDSAYGTSNVLLTYVIGIAYLLLGKIKFLPMLGVFAVIIAIYIVSTGFAHKSTHIGHAIYIFNFGSAILMFYIVYNFVRDSQDVGLVIRTMVVLNVLVVIYCVIQMNVGPQFAIFGIEELTINGVRRGGDPRLAGPYGVGITAEFMVISILLYAFILTYTTSAIRRRLAYLMMALSLGCLIATANRGGFLVLVGSSGLFLMTYRRQLGVMRTLTISISGIFLIAIMSIVVIQFTEFGQMYDRLEGTEIEGGIPDTREKTWTTTWGHIADRPILGRGPMFRLTAYGVHPTNAPVMEFPHNLYLYLLYTAGVVGLIVYFFYFWWLIVRFKAGIKNSIDDPFMHGFMKLGIILMVVFLVDQIKVEFLRFQYIDYWHYIFSIFAIWLAFADMAKNGRYRGAEANPVMRRAALGLRY